MLTKLLRCSTPEECRRIQAGYLPLRRLGRWSVLFTIAFALVINDLIGFGVDRVVQQHDDAVKAYEKLADVYRKCNRTLLSRLICGVTLKEDIPKELPKPPKVDQLLLNVYRLLNWLQLAFFLAYCAYCLRWVYADFNASGNSNAFREFCLVAAITNLALYFILSTATSHYLNLAPSHALQRTAPAVTLTTSAAALPPTVQSAR